MKQKYEEMDGNIIELEYDEYINLPFNSRLKLIKEEGENSKVDKVRTQEKNIDSMTKDELLDYTAIHGITADYQMTKKELLKIIKNNKQGDKNG